MGDRVGRDETESAARAVDGSTDRAEDGSTDRAEVEPADPFEVWTVATFDLAAFSLVVLLAGHLSGALAGALTGLGTVPGLAAFGYLWALVIVAVRWVLSGGGIADGDRSIGSLLIRGTIGGAGVGVGLVGGGVLVGSAVAVVRAPELLTTVAFVAVIGSVIGAVVGAVAGVASAVCSVAVARASERIVPETGPDYSSSSSS
ncbi:hypothetical protein [Halobellus rarus]|uniref:DUF7965 domain-containing protein n=1 Tax=Halobellus rarus TaxID=1126237 RepID=A0ABD6CHT4_9EURY|nr:hypothetical protein [Halobellus rarus]